MPDFPRRKTQPMQPSSYRAAARTLRKMADQLDERAAPQTPRERASLTSVIHRIAQYGRHLSHRHRMRHGHGTQEEKNHQAG